MKHAMNCGAENKCSSSESVRDQARDSTWSVHFFHTSVPFLRLEAQEYLDRR